MLQKGGELQVNSRNFLFTKMIILVLSFLGMNNAVAETYRVSGLGNSKALNIRAKPSTKSKKIGSIPRYGKGIEKLGPCKSSWCKIKYKGKVGWSSMKYLKRESSKSPTYRVRGVRNFLVIRAGSSVKSKKIGSIPPDGRGIIKLGKCKEKRCKISYGGVTGWSSMKYLVVEKSAKPSLKPEKTIQNSLYKDGMVALITVKQDGVKSKPYKLKGKTYSIEVSGTVSYKTDPEVTDISGTYGVDACYLFSFTPSDVKVPPVAIKLLKNTGNNDVCGSGRYNPQHIYRSTSFFSKNSYQFWIDNSAFRAKPSGGGFLNVRIYENE